MGEPGSTINEFQTRDSNNHVIQHPTFKEAYSVFKSSDDYFKISYGDTNGNSHRWIWMLNEAVWADKPIVIKTEYDGETPYSVTIYDEIERLTDEEFCAKHH